jgi:HAE1 family hydrophobic/amphiphilic exporter-1
MSISAAIIESVRNRTRPIFMTTVTTLLGLAPLVFFPGAGSELYRGLGAVVLGGLLVSTVFTLILVPTLLRLTFAVFKPERQEIMPESTEPEMDDLFRAPPARKGVEQLAGTAAPEN